MASADTTGPVKVRRRRFEGLNGREMRVFLLFISPAVLGFLAFKLYPFVFSLLMSFSTWDLFTPFRFVGLKNYIKIFTNDRYFLLSIGVTFKFALLSVPLGLVAALAVALLMDAKVRGITFFRTLWYSPAVVPGIAVSVLWIGLFNSRYGLINRFLLAFGIHGPNWLWDPFWVLPAFILMDLWGIGASMIIYLAALQSVPDELYSAADIDGASRWRKFVSITMPMISPLIFFNVIMAVMGIMGYFNNAFVMTGGGPGNSTLFYALYIYQQAFRLSNYGYGAALSWISSIISLILTLITFRSSPLWVFYETTRRGK